MAARIRARITGDTCSRPAPRGRSSKPPRPSRSYRSIHRSTVGRDTDANTAMSFFGRCSACHNTIRALVATVAGTSALFNSALSSVRSSIVNSTPQVNNTAGQTDVK